MKFTKNNRIMNFILDINNFKKKVIKKVQIISFIFAKEFGKQNIIKIYNEIEFRKQYCLNE